MFTWVPVEDRHRERCVLGQDAPEIVGVGQGHVALPGRDRLQHLGVAVDQDRIVGDPPPHDALGLGLAVPLDQGRDQGLVVDVGRGTQAEPPLPLGIPEGLVGGKLLRLHLLGVVHDAAGPYREPDPAVLGIAQMGGDIGLDLG
jgi:hypothetical protein